MKMCIHQQYKDIVLSWFTDNKVKISRVENCLYEESRRWSHYLLKVRYINDKHLEYTSMNMRFRDEDNYSFFLLCFGHIIEINKPKLIIIG